MSAASYQPLPDIDALRKLGTFSQGVCHAHIQATDKNYSWWANNSDEDDGKVVIAANGVPAGRWIQDGSRYYPENA